jgi:hypothetical protein
MKDFKYIYKQSKRDIISKYNIYNSNFLNYKFKVNIFIKLMSSDSNFFFSIFCFSQILYY